MVHYGGIQLYSFDLRQVCQLKVRPAHEVPQIYTENHHIGQLSLRYTLEEEVHQQKYYLVLIAE